jgi:1-aminocyclopropane-1-carboxylate deaminase/D-cysteine desulfhydrase-like pyridoxal-dependent ACC family enzyme
MRTVFPVQSLSRSQVQWEQYLGTLTPITRVNGRAYKREDFFAPLGYGGINGSKLRQLIYLVQNYRQSGGRAGLITGASVLSPQISMAALVAAHYELPALMVLGGSKPETSIKHENVAIAARAGATFSYVPVGFNPTLQRSVGKLAQEPQLKDYFRLHYGITTPEAATARDVAGFHAVGAPQAANIPDDIEHLIMPAGSCNSCTSVLFGIAQHRPKALRKVTLLGIGPTRLRWIEDRMESIHQATGVDVMGLFRPRYHQHPDLEPAHRRDAPYELEHYDLHSTGYVKYADRKPFSLDGIDFHPTYEGKCLTYMAEHRDTFSEWWEGDGKTLFWIVGSKPTAGAMTRHLQ